MTSQATPGLFKATKPYLSALITGSNNAQKLFRVICLHYCLGIYRLLSARIKVYFAIVGNVFANVIGELRTELSKIKGEINQAAICLTDL